MGWQDMVEKGEVPPHVFHTAFGQARAAAAVAFALVQDQTSALECLYEAHHAIDDHDAFVREVESALAN